MNLRSPQVPPGSDTVFVTIAGLVLGYLASLITMPEDIVTPGALKTPAILFCCGMLAGPAFGLFKRGFEYVLRAECAITVAIIFFVLLDMIQGIYPLEGVSRQAASNVFFAITLFCVTIAFAAGQRPWKLPQMVTRTAAVDYSPQFLESSLWVCCILGLFYFAYMANFSPVAIFNGLTKGRFAAPWSRGMSGGWNAFIEHMIYFGYLLPPITVLLALRERTWFSRRVATGLFLCLLFLPFVLQGGGRRIFAMCVGSAIFTWICAQRRNIRPRHLLILVLFVAASLITMDMMLANRNHGAMEFSYALDNFEYVRVDDNFLRFAQILDLIPNSYPHTTYHWIIWVLARPIPRVLWPSKPVSPGFDLSGVVGVTASLSCSSIAEWYEAFGWFGLLAGGYLYGRLARFWSQLLDLNLPVSSIGVYSIGLMALAISIRSMIELILMSYPLFAVVILTRLTQGGKQVRTPPDRPSSTTGMVVGTVSIDRA